MVYLRSMKAQIRFAGPADFELIAKVGRETFYETWKDVNTPEDMAVYLEKAFKPASILEDLENPANTFLVAEAGDEILGYAKIRRDRTYDEFKGESAIEIERVYVYGKYQSQKIGKLLMDACIDLSKKEDFKWLWLGVNVDNHKAINFYKAYDFTIFGEKGFQLGDAIDLDYLMKKLLK